MRKTALTVLAILTGFGAGYAVHLLMAKNGQNAPAEKTVSAAKSASAVPVRKEKEGHMKLGAFSMSLSVKDLQASKNFYEQLGFSHFAGDFSQHYLIMKNGNALIGLFEGMFQGNILTFNPGWDENAQNIEAFDDVREIKRRLREAGITSDAPVDEQTSGPAGFMITDPDGNMILIDQHR